METNSQDSKPKQDIIEFLCGSGSYDGLWFGGKPPTDRRSPFWWRRKLREYVDALKEERDKYYFLYEDYSGEVDELQQERRKLEEERDLLKAEIAELQRVYANCSAIDRKTIGDFKAENERLKSILKLKSLLAETSEPADPKCDC